MAFLLDILSSLKKMTFPSIQLVGAIFVVDIISTLITLFGWLVPNSTTTDIVTVILIWMYSVGMTLLLFLVFYLVNHVYFSNKV